MGLLRLGSALAGTLLTACGSSPTYVVDRPKPILVQEPTANPLPEPTPAPSCVKGHLVNEHRVCGLGVAGKALHWNDEKMRGLARRRAARNLAGMLRAVVTSALVIEEDEENYWSRQERYLEIDDALVDRIEGVAKVEIWFDVNGKGPFREAERTYACACMDSSQAGLRIDPQQARRNAFARQYAVEEVPRWLTDTTFHNESLKCAVGYHERMFHPEDMLEPLTNSVREQLVGITRTWLLSEFDDREVCDDRFGAECLQTIESVLQAANEGVSRGVAMTAMWFDTLGIGPNRKRMSAYGWGCVFDAVALKAARERLLQLRGVRAPQVQGSNTEAPTVARASSAR